MLAEFLVVLAHSRRTHWILAIGVALSLALLLVGKPFVEQLDLKSLQGRAEATVLKIARHYDKAALLILVYTVVAAATTYRKDRKRLLGE